MSSKYKRMSSRYIGAAVLAFMIAVLIAACGGGGGSVVFNAGGGGGGAGAPVSSIANNTKTYLFFQGSDFSLTAADPVSGASTPIVVGGAAGIVPASGVGVSVGSSPYVAFGGTFSAATISDKHTQALVYANAGKLWQVSAIAGASAPAATQVSSIAFGMAGKANMYCSSPVLSDYANPASSVIVVRQAGADLACDTVDDLVFWTRLGTGAATAPTALAAGTKVAALYNLSTGAISGTLMLVPTAGSYNLIQTDATLNTATAVTVKAGVAAPLALLTTSSTGIQLMELGGTLWKYDPALGVSPTNPAAVGFTFASTPTFLSDGTNAFFRMGTSFYSVPMDGSAAPTLMYTEPAGTTFRYMMLTNNRIVYDWFNAASNGVSSLPKTAAGAGATPTVLKSGANVAPGTVTNYWLHSTSGTGVNFSDIWGGLAHHCNEDGTGLVTFGSVTSNISASWDGRVESTTDTIGVNTGSMSARAFLYSTDFTKATPDTLAAYDTATGSLVANLGSWASGSLWDGGSEYLANNGATVYFLKAPFAPNYADPYLVNVNASNSAQQLANTPTVNETKVGAGVY